MQTVAAKSGIRGIKVVRHESCGPNSRKLRAPLRIFASNEFNTGEIDTEALKAKVADSMSSATTVIKAKWEETEDKPAVVSLAVAALVGLVALNAVADAVDSIPVVSNLMELVGICASSWFLYRYVVFQPDREELKQNIMDFFSKVQGKKA